jgi:phenylacetate-CoA ligase
MQNNPTLFTIAWDAWRAEQSGAPALALRQHRRLGDLVAFARAHSPWYQQHYSQLPAAITERRQLPPVTKPELMAHFDDWVTDPALTREGLEAFLADKALIGQPYLGRYFVCTTSGTTGHPAILVHDPAALNVYTVIDALRGYMRWMTPRQLWALLRAGGRTASIIAIEDHFGAFAMKERLNQRHPLLKTYMTRQSRFLSVTRPVSELVQELNAYQPARLMGYATAIAVLAEEQAAGRLQIHPRFIGTAGEWLAPAEREQIKAVFRCPVRDAYGSSECFSDAFECEHGWLHNSEDWVILEPVDETYQPVPAGQPSSTVLLTNLANRIQPVIRYDLGDSITIRPDPCPCGSLLPALRVTGRRSAILHMQAPTGARIAILPLALSTVIEEVPGVHRFQVIQTAPATLRLRLEVVSGAEPSQVWDTLAEHLHVYLSAQGLPSVVLEHDSEPPQRDPVSGKFRHVWSEVTIPVRELSGVQ